MEIKRLSPDYAVSPQITPQDVEAIAAAGFHTIICNRPDPEIPAELHADRIGDITRDAGLAFVVNPVIGGSLSYENLAAQQAAMTSASGPVLAYCASGNRSAIVWSMIQARSGEMDPEAILRATTRAGYEHSGLRDHLKALAEAAKEAG